MHQQKEIDSIVQEASKLDQDDLYRLLGQTITENFRFDFESPLGIGYDMKEKRVESLRLKKGNDHSLTEGKEAFKKFKKKFKKVICGKGGPYEQFKKGLLGQEKLPHAIAIAILAGSSVTGLMAAVYFALLLTKTGLKMYCEK